MTWHIISNSFRLASPICCFILEVPEVHRLPSLWQWELPTCRQCQMNFLSQNPWQNSPGRQQSSTCGLQGAVQLLQLHKRGIGPTISDNWNPMKSFFPLKHHDFHDFCFFFPSHHYQLDYDLNFRFWTKVVYLGRPHVYYCLTPEKGTQHSWAQISAGIC